MSAEEDARHVVAEMNRLHRVCLTLQGPLAGGYQGGAWLVTDPDGRERVLKYGGGDLDRRRIQKTAIDRLIARGYPTPAWSLVGRTEDGVVYHLQEFAIGEPITFSKETAVLLRGVIELQAGMAPDIDQDWTRFITEEALGDNEGGVRQFLRNLGPQGRDLVAHYDRLLSSVEISPLSKADFVHGDFSTGNLLIHDGAISGVVDSQALGKGTRVVDYAWLIREIISTEADPAAADILRSAAEAVEGPGALIVCITATALDIVRWVQTYGSIDVHQLIARMHDLADYLS